MCFAPHEVDNAKISFRGRRGQGEFYNLKKKLKDTKKTPVEKHSALELF